MLIARRNLMAGGGTPTAKDYVQDGLIAMWDGIENAGWGQHDPNATVWKDLAGSHDFVLPSAFSIGDDCVVFTKTQGEVQSWGIAKNDILTIEVCGKKTSTVVGFAFKFNGDYVAERMFAYLQTNNRGFQFVSSGNTMNRPAHDAKWTASATFEMAESSLTELVETFYNGYSSPMNAGTSSWAKAGAYIGYYNGDTYAFVGEMYSVRLYSRALLASEIAANYAIDKARFNLPDAA